MARRRSDPFGVIGLILLGIIAVVVTAIAKVVEEIGVITCLVLAILIVAAAIYYASYSRKTRFEALRAKYASEEIATALTAEFFEKRSERSGSTIGGAPIAMACALRWKKEP